MPDIPEDATEEPRILTPEEDAERAARRADLEESEQLEIWPEPNDPLRQPGELSPPPAKHKH
jgi:hypothetical protein